MGVMMLYLVTMVQLDNIMCEEYKYPSVLAVGEEHCQVV